MAHLMSSCCRCTHSEELPLQGDRCGLHGLKWGVWDTLARCSCNMSLARPFSCPPTLPHWVGERHDIPGDDHGEETRGAAVAVAVLQSA